MTTYIDLKGNLTSVELLDEDNMASDSATKGATQQSIKAYVDASGSGILSESFESSEILTTAASTSTQAHGLSGLPKVITTVLRCKVAEHGYSVGDEVQYTNTGDDQANHDGFMVTFDATNLVSRVGSGMGTLWILHKTTGNLANLTNTSWRFVVKALY